MDPGSIPSEADVPIHSSASVPAAPAMPISRSNPVTAPPSPQRAPSCPESGPDGRDAGRAPSLDVDALVTGLGAVQVADDAPEPAHDDRAAQERTPPTTPLKKSTSSYSVLTRSKSKLLSGTLSSVSTTASSDIGVMDYGENLTEESWKAAAAEATKAAATDVARNVDIEIRSWARRELAVRIGTRALRIKFDSDRRLGTSEGQKVEPLVETVIESNEDTDHTLAYAWLAWGILNVLTDRRPISLLDKLRERCTYRRQIFELVGGEIESRVEVWSSEAVQSAAEKLELTIKDLWDTHKPYEERVLGVLTYCYAHLYEHCFMCCRHLPKLHEADLDRPETILPTTCGATRCAKKASEDLRNVDLGSYLKHDHVLNLLSFVIESVHRTMEHPLGDRLLPFVPKRFEKSIEADAAADKAAASRAADAVVGSDAAPPAAATSGSTSEGPSPTPTIPPIGPMINPLAALIKSQLAGGYGLMSRLRPVANQDSDSEARYDRDALRKDLDRLRALDADGLRALGSDRAPAAEKRPLHMLAWWMLCMTAPRVRPVDIAKVLEDGRAHKLDYSELEREDMDRLVVALELRHPADKERDFAEAAARHGKVQCVHGSDVERFWSILLNGFRVLSDTKIMANAAFFGSGLYMGTSFATSKPYSTRKTKAHLPTGKPGLGKFWAMAVLDVADHSTSSMEDADAALYRPPDAPDVVVARRTEGVLLFRYLLIFKGDE
ncbi:hypothetical protein DFJ74DRAFT_695744 [Hyaloraphidium curvatum]|nr:hypothetical protein DFJ74DRAFT_695744 [Hyaloraphidium curvatum]